MNSVLEIRLRLRWLLGLWTLVVATIFISFSTFACDWQHRASIAYDEGSRSAFSYDSVRILLVDRKENQLAGANGVFAKIAGFLAADTIDPSLVRFSQDSISATFKDGGSVGDLAAGLQNGTINPSDIPPIRLVNNDGTLFTLDNRRLAAFQQAGVPIPYQMATPEEAAAQAWKFTTQNGGTSIHIIDNRII